MITREVQGESTTRRPPGRPSGFNKETADLVVELLKLGNFMETAAAYAGVTARTVRNWMAKGKRESGSEFAEFRKSVLQAKAIAEVNDLEELKKSKDWCVIAWRMERRNPKAWGRKKVVMVQTGARRRQRTLEEISAEMDEILGDGHVSAGAGQ